MPAPIVAPRTTSPQAISKPIIHAPVDACNQPIDEPSSSPGTCTPPPSEAVPIPFTLEEDHRGDDSSSAYSSTMNPNDVSEDAMAGIIRAHLLIESFNTE